jgi:hypothetical protein
VTDTDLDTDSGADTPARSTPPARSGRLVIIALAVLLAIVAGIVFWATRPDDDSATPRATTTTAAPSTTASDEEPPGTDPAAVEPYIAALLTNYDEITSQILADPAIASDPQHALYADLRALLAADSEMTDPVVRALDRRGDQGITQEPLEEGKLPVRRTVEGDVETVSADEVTFSTCTRYDYRLVNSDGAPVEVGVGESEPGEGVAVRVDGHWVLSRLEMSGQLARCEETE